MLHVTNIFMYGVKMTNEQLLDFLNEEYSSEEEQDNAVIDLCRTKHLVNLDSSTPDSSWILGVPIDSPMNAEDAIGYQNEYFEFMGKHFNQYPTGLLYSAFYSELMTY